MACALDVAEYILSKQGTLPAMKLQKLVYYSQAWSLVWDDRPMFDDNIEAWINGPVVRSLYQQHRGQYEVQPGSTGGDAGKLDQTAIDTVAAVLDTYGDKSSQWLSSLTHREDPWIAAREGLGPSERGNVSIPRAAMAEYYSGLTD